LEVDGLSFEKENERGWAQMGASRVKGSKEQVETAPREDQSGISIRGGDGLGFRV